MTVRWTPTSCVASARRYTISMTFWNCQSCNRSLHAVICRLCGGEKGAGAWTPSFQALSFLSLRNYFCHLCRPPSATLWMPCRRDCVQTCAIILLHNGVWPLSLKASFSTSLSTTSRRCWCNYRLSFIDFKTTWAKGLNQRTEMDEDKKCQVDSLPCNA